MHRSILLVALLLGWICQGQSLAAERQRFAVVIGNDAYPGGAALANPVNDSRAMHEALQDLDFEVRHFEDAKLGDMQAAVDWIAREARPGSLALFFYAGHAVQVAGRNYLLPLDFKADSTEAVKKSALVADQVVESMQKAGVEVALVILDACRNNPFGTPDGALGAGLAFMEHLPGQTLIAYSTAAQSVANDGTGPNSPYTGALVSVLQEPGLSIFDVFSEVRRRVRTATNGLQLPWVSGSIEASVVLNPQPPQQVEMRLEPVSLPVASFWETIRDSRNPADFNIFLASYGNSELAKSASDRLSNLVEAGLGALPPIELSSFRQDGLDEAVTDCDIVVSDDEDPWRMAPAVPFGLVNSRLALRTCAADLARQPDEPRLLFLMGRALDTAGRYDEARAFYRQAADGGYPAAMVNLGYLALEAKGQDQDLAVAAQRYRQAALLGNPRGRVNLGDLYLKGQGLPQSDAAGLYWTRLAAEVGWSNAINALGDMYRRGQAVAKDPGRASIEYEKAAMLGNHEAMNNLGRLYEAGAGVAKDLAVARRWYERAIAAGNRFAPRWLGRHYLEGWGVEANAEEALRLFRLSADRGFGDGYMAIGEMLETGKGVAADRPAALLNYRLAGFLGQKKAKDKAAEIAKSLDEATRERVEKEALFWKATRL